MERMVKKAREMVLNDEVPGELPLKEEVANHFYFLRDTFSSILPVFPLFPLCLLYFIAL